LKLERDSLCNFVTSKSRETNEEEKLAPSMVRQVAPPAPQLQREQVAPRVVRQVAPPVVPTQRELNFKGIQPSGSSREEKPPRTMQRTMNREWVPGIMVSVISIFEAFEFVAF
jgi:hypothetical protein